VTAPTSDPAAEFGWALRHYRWLVVALAALALALAGSLAAWQEAQRPGYEATALVIANDLAHSPEQLPRLAEALLANDSVADDAIAAGSLPWSPRELRDEHVELTPLEQNILIEVTGKAADPDLAARAANVVADALAEALNRPGEGVGVFSVQHQANPPTEPAEDRTVLLYAAGGLVLAILLPLGVVGLLLALRRPVSRPGDAGDVVGAQVVGVLSLPSQRRAPRPWAPEPAHRLGHGILSALGLAAEDEKSNTPAPADVPGLVALCRTVFPDGKGICLLSAPTDAARTRTAVAGWLVEAMAAQSDVVVVPAAPPRASDDVPSPIIVLGRPIGHLPDYAPVVIDGFDDDTLTARQPMPEGARGVLVVPEGSPRTAVIDAGERFADDELAGVVFVRR
jgi:capsular polysaccharide biosynthesis protein